MFTVNQRKLDEIDLWGCEEDVKVKSTFEKTFSKQVDDVDFDGNLEFIAQSQTKEGELSNSSSRQRPKPQRQDTLSGNNPFRKLSFSEENNKECLNVNDELPFVSRDVDLEGSETGFDPLNTIYPDTDEDKDRSDSSESSEDGFQSFEITNINKISNSSVRKEKYGEISVLPAPKISSGIKGPRERKLPPEARSFRRLKDDSNSDDLFSNLREENDKCQLEIVNDHQAITFDSPLSGHFTSEQIEWETFPTSTDTANNDEKTIWGEEIEFKSEFEPLPHEIITFEPFNPINENLEWKLLIRQPEKKSKAKQMSRYTSNRWWKDVYIRLGKEKDRPCLKFYENLEDSEPYRVVRIEPYMQLSRDKLQQYDKYGKLHIFKINHVVYKEMVGMRTEKFSLKNLHNLVTHKPKMNMVLDHMPMRTELVKFGALDKKPVRSLMTAIEDSMLSIKTHRDMSLEYTKEEVCCYVNDEYLCELNEEGSIVSQKARTRILFAAFVTGNPYIVLGINDKWRFGNEIVRRQDIIPIMHDNWITIYEPEFHSCIDMVEYEKDHMIKFYPLDGCKFELMRFRVPLRPNKELPLLTDVKFKTNGASVELRVNLSVPGFFSVSKRHGAVHCDDIEIRVPIPEEWAYHFRVEKHTKYGSVHSTLRKPGKIKGFERITQLAQSFLPVSMLEASVGVAKYEHLFRAIVWRIPRLPEKNEASYKPHMMTCKFILAPHDNVPCLDDMCQTFHVDFTMSASTVSGATIRSISVEHTSTPERFVKYLATFKYTRRISYELGDIKPPPIKSIFDQDTETPNDAHSSDESTHDGSSDHSSPRKSPCSHDSVDLLGMDIVVEGANQSTAESHSAIDDLLTLDCFAQHNPSSKSSSFTKIILDDIAMVDDDIQSD